MDILQLEGSVWVCFCSALYPAKDEGVVNFLKASEHKHGGFGGSPGQIGHLANTYAGVAAAITIGEVALQCIDRSLTSGFLEARCVPPDRGGGFEVCDGGEVDVRGCYTALAIAHMLGLEKAALAEKSGVVDFVCRCQTYEGGLGGEPGNEAHGGYTYCGLAALMLINRADALDLPSLLHFAVRCQGSVEGGFMGRTNKLVDGCYSFWQGGLFPLLQRLGPEYLSQAGIPPKLSNIPALNEGFLREPMIVPSLPEVSRPLTLEEQADQAIQHCQDVHEEKLKRLNEVRQRMDAGSEELSQGAAMRLAVAACSNAEADLAAALARRESLQHRAATSANDDLQDRATGGGSELLHLYDAEALQSWLLSCCQAQHGGMRDKPGVGPDFYHTCYCLSGLSSAQHFGGLKPPWTTGVILAQADPLCNVVVDKLDHALHYYH